MIWYTYNGNNDLVGVGEKPPSKTDMLVACIGTGKCSVECGTETGPVFRADIHNRIGAGLALAELEVLN